MAECCPIGGLCSMTVNGNVMDFVTFNPGKTAKILSDGSDKTIRGTLDHYESDTDEGLQFVGFTVSMYMTQQKMAILLPLMGLEAAGTTYTLKDPLPATGATSPYNIVFDSYGTRSYTYTDCHCGSWSVQGQKGANPIMIQLTFVAKSVTSAALPNSGVAPMRTTVVAANIMYGFTRGVMTIEGAERKFNQFQLNMDYGLNVEFNNSATATNVCPTDHSLTIDTSVLFSACGDSTQALLEKPMGISSGQAAGSLTDGAAFSIEFERTTSAGAVYTTSFTVANVKLVARPPSITRKDFIRLPIRGIGYRTGATRLLVVENSAA